MPEINIGSIKLTEDEIDWLRVIGNLSGESLRSQMRQIVKGHLVRFKPQYLKQVNYVARKYGLTLEEAFIKLKTEEPPFGEVVNQAPISAMEEVTNFGCEVSKEAKQDGASNSGNGDADA